MPESLEVIPEIMRKELKLVKNNIIPRLQFMYAHLEVPLAEAGRLAKHTIELCGRDRPILSIEKDVREYLEAHGVFRSFDQKMDFRTLLWYQKIAPHIVGTTFLDLGGGDGRTAKRVYDERRNSGSIIDPCIADVLDYSDRVRGIPYFQTKQTTTPFANDSFDIVFVGTVFHHVGKELDDSLELVAEAVRIAKKRLIVVESVYRDEKERLYTMLIDWFYNRVLRYSAQPDEKVNVPFNFRKPEQWAEEIEKRGMGITRSNDLGIFQILNPEHHWLYVADKTKKGD